MHRKIRAKASKICETTSGGVKIAPITNAPTMTYGLYSLTFLHLSSQNKPI